MTHEEIKLEILRALIAQIDLKQYMSLQHDHIRKKLFKDVLEVAEFMAKEFTKDNT